MTARNPVASLIYECDIRKNVTYYSTPPEVILRLCDRIKPEPLWQAEYPLH